MTASRVLKVSMQKGLSSLAAGILYYVYTPKLPREGSETRRTEVTDEAAVLSEDPDM